MWQDRGVTIPSGPKVLARAWTISVVLFLSSTEAVLAFQTDRYEARGQSPARLWHDATLEPNEHRTGNVAVGRLEPADVHPNAESSPELCRRRGRQTHQHSRYDHDRCRAPPAAAA